MWKTKPSFSTSSTGLWPFNYMVSLEILKINRLLDGVAGIAPAPCPLGNDWSPLLFLLASLPTSCVDEEIDWPMNALRIHRCVAERPSRHPPQDQLGQRVPSPHHNPRPPWSWRKEWWCWRQIPDCSKWGQKPGPKIRGPLEA